MTSEPVIITASRATDIPAFHGEWFMERLREGAIDWLNPFNRKVYPISLAKTRAIVFWTKNPEPLLPLLNELDALGYSYYFTFTLNDYEDEGLEPGLPPLQERIETFVRLSSRLGKERVVWRYDPVILGGGLTPQKLQGRIESVGARIAPYTEKLVISFVDIERYRKVRRQLRAAGDDPFREPNVWEIREIAAGLQTLNKNWELKLSTCAEPQELSEYGFVHNRCVDGELLAKCFPGDVPLMEHLGYRSRKSLFGLQAEKINNDRIRNKGQRKDCGCIPAKDIGGYGTCGYACRYCYAR